MSARTDTMSACLMSLPTYGKAKGLIDDAKSELWDTLPIGRE